MLLPALSQRQERAWRKGRIVEYHAFEGLHVVEYDDGQRLLHNLAKKKHRVAGSGDDSASKKAKTEPAAAGGASAAAADDDDSEDDDSDTMPAPTASSSSHDAPVITTATAIMSVSGAAEVDPESGLVGKGHVLSEGGVVYEANLAEVGLPGHEEDGWWGRTTVLLVALVFQIDLSQNMDKYYNLQVVESSDKSQCW